jgi:hypothetical protein
MSDIFEGLKAGDHAVYAWDKVNFRLFAVYPVEQDTWEVVVNKSINTCIVLDQFDDFDQVMHKIKTLKPLKAWHILTDDEEIWSGYPGDAEGLPTHTHLYALIFNRMYGQHGRNFIVSNQVKRWLGKKRGIALQDVVDEASAFIVDSDKWLRGAQHISRVPGSASINVGFTYRKKQFVMVFHYTYPDDIGRDIIIRFPQEAIPATRPWEIDISD